MKRISQLIFMFAKEEYIELFEEKKLIQSEKLFVFAYREMCTDYKPKFQKTRDNAIVLTWKSDVECTLGCYVTKEEMKFSEIYVFDEMEKQMTIPSNLRFPPESEKGKCIVKEVGMIKELCKIFSWDIEYYFT